MEKATVYYTNFRTKLEEGLPAKLKRLLYTAGIGTMDLEGKFVAIKMHFGELGNLGFLRPNYAKAVADVVKALGGKPFLTDCNTLYPGSRKNALEHLYCAWENGFTAMTVGCPILIGDGLKGTDDIAVPVRGGEYVKQAWIGRAIMDADVLISLTHFKGHEVAGFGGAIKISAWDAGPERGKRSSIPMGSPRFWRQPAGDAGNVCESVQIMGWNLMNRPGRCTSTPIPVWAAAAASEPAILTRFGPTMARPGR